MSWLLTLRAMRYWRVVYEGHDLRVKVYPDGRRERFDGKRNRPPKAFHKTLSIVRRWSTSG